MIDYSKIVADKILTPNDYRMAMDSQSAVNGGALVKSLASVVPKLWEESMTVGNPRGTDFVNQHPIMVLYLTQLVFLAGGSAKWDIPPHYRYYEAHSFVERRMKTE